MKKAVRSILCLLAVLLAAAAVTASAADVVDSGTCGEVNWTLDKDGTLTLSGSGSTDYYHPKSEWPWDPYHGQIKSVVVQDGVHFGRIFEDFGEREGYYPALTTVTINATDYYFDVADAASFGFSPFRGCNNLQEINVTGRNSYYSSVDGVLYNRDKTCLYLFPAGKSEADIPKTVTTIHFYAFENCQKLTDLTIPDNVETVYGSAFSDCTGLTSVEIGAGLNLLYNTPFLGADNITAIRVAEENQHFSAVDNVLYSKDRTRLVFCPAKTTVTLPASLTIAPSHYEFSSRVEHIEVDPGNPNFTAVDGILYNKDLTKLLCCPQGRTGTVIVPDDVTIDDSAFENCSALSNIVLPVGLEKLSRFGGCTSLESLTLPGSVTEIPYYNLFSQCNGLKDIYFTGNEDQWKAMLEKVKEDDKALLEKVNVWFVPGEAEKSPILSAELTGGGSPALTARLFYDGAEPASACFAFYSGDGKQLGAEVMVLPKNGGVTKSIAAPDGTAGAKVFVLNADNARPLCDAVPAK